MSYKGVILEIITEKVIISNLMAQLLHIVYCDLKTRAIKSTEAPY